MTTAKYLMDDVPKLLNSDDTKNTENVFSAVFTSLPSDFAEFIKWVAEIRRKEDGAHGLSEEEKGRLNIKVKAEEPYKCICILIFYPQC